MAYLQSSRVQIEGRTTVGDPRIVQGIIESKDRIDQQVTIDFISNFDRCLVEERELGFGWNSEVRDEAEPPKSILLDSN